MAIMADTSPPEVFAVHVIHSLLRSFYCDGKILTHDENALLIGLKTLPSAVSVALKLLECEELYVHQFAATLLIQSLELADPQTFTDFFVQHFRELLSRYAAKYRHEPSARKIQRYLMSALGVVLRTKVDWKNIFYQFITSIQSDFFESENPCSIALDSLFAFCKFSGSKLTGRKDGTAEGEATEMVICYFGHLLASNLLVYDSRQAEHLHTISDWVREANFGTPDEHVGSLMTAVAQFIDCPERQSFPWGEVQIQASLALAEFLSLSDIHFLQNSLMNVLRVILGFNMTDRVNRMSSYEEARVYLETMAKVMLAFNLDFADIVVASTERAESRGLIVELVLRLRILADPFPDRENTLPSEELYSKDAVAAFAELASLMYEMCGSGSEVADPLLPELKGIFRILVKKSCKPPADIFSRWSQDEKEIFAELQKDIHKAAESLALAVPQALICWFLEEFEACLKDISSLSVHKRVAALCTLLQYSFCDKIEESALRSLFGGLHQVLGVQDLDVVHEAFVAIGVWIPLIEKESLDVIQLLIPVCLSALQQNRSDLTNACAPTMAALVEKSVEMALRVYPELSAAIVANLMDGTGNVGSRGHLLSSFGRLIAALPVEKAVLEIDGLYLVFESMMKKQSNKRKLQPIIKIITKFFQAIWKREGVETTLIHESVAHISLRLLEYLHGVEAFRMDQPSQSEAADEVFSSLLKEMLYASGTAAGQILPVITPFVGAAFTFNQSAGMLSCVNELLTVYLNKNGYEALFSQLCTHTFSTVIQLGLKDNWPEYTEVYRPFVLAVYPVVRQRADLFMKLPIDWEKLLQLVIKLMFLPPTGGTDSVIQSQILFEELVRVKSMEVEAAGAESGPNYIKELLMDRYGRDLVVGFLTVFRNPASDERQVRTCSECLYTMLMELSGPTKQWLHENWRLINSGDAADQMAFEKFITAVMMQRSKHALNRQVALYRRKFLG